MGWIDSIIRNRCVIFFLSLLSLDLSSFLFMPPLRPLTCSVTALSLSRSATRPLRIAVVGGGASGIFSAIAAAEAALTNSSPDKTGTSTKRRPPVNVVVLEAGSSTLTKVKISGGGRCNVLHDTSKAVPDLLSQGYPRGKMELTGLFQKRFGPAQAREWFERRGVTLKTEPDGRMFPHTDSSQTIIDTLLHAAQASHVSIQTRCKVESVTCEEENAKDDKSNQQRIFKVSLQQKLSSEQDARKEQREEFFHAVILATGSSPVGYKLAKSLGHTIVSPVASLFTLSAKHDVKEGGLLYDLSGLSVPHARVSYRIPSSSSSSSSSSKEKSRRTANALLAQEGPLLITHHGLSGPAALRLSAFGAREFAAQGYRGTLMVHWAPSLGTASEIADELWKQTSLQSKKAISTYCPLRLPDGSPAIPKRLWAAMVLKAGFSKDTIWAEAPKKLIRALATIISDCPIEMTSKGTFKEEFVTAGGINLKEIDMKTMQSKVCPGLFFCGELINVDGVTGGFNFMNCWYVL